MVRNIQRLVFGHASLVNCSDWVNEVVVVQDSRILDHFAIKTVDGQNQTYNEVGVLPELPGNRQLANAWIPVDVHKRRRHGRELRNLEDFRIE